MEGKLKKEMKNMTEEEFRNKMLNTLLSFKNNKIYNESLVADIEIRTSSMLLHLNQNHLMFKKKKQTLEIIGSQT